MYTNILVPYDGSMHAQRALEHATAFAAAQESHIEIIYVDPTASELLEQPLMIPTHELEAYFEEEEEQVRQQLRTLTASMPDASIQILQGHAGQEIVKYAAAHQVELIIIGHRGLGTFSELMLGSVSHYVSQHAQCPVLIVK
ncbi:universal stress protein [Paenibacillus shenyangensis]|uniref:universal stress protein n=1 Tax=Paenibacillus sp. A9 TaxID=1284352 RepID=UPI00036D2106|nr:universal stress protein [Paenibacillus sp. A9]